MTGWVYLRAVWLLWTVWLVTWWLAALWRSKPTATAPRGSWRGPFALVALGFVLLGLQRPDSERMWPIGPALGWSMVALTAGSFAFAWWARLTMGRQWSGGVMRTAEHRVIQDGPFAWVRHPIYTALIAAAAALAVVRGTRFGLSGAGLIASGFYLKARVEERFLTEQLDGYPEYRERVPMLVPFVR